MARTRFRVVALVTGSYRGNDFVNRSWQITRKQERELLTLLGRAPDIEALVPPEAAEAMMAAGQERGMPLLELQEDPEELELDQVMAAPIRSLVHKMTPTGDVMLGIIYGVMPKAEADETEVEVPMVRDGWIVIKGDEFSEWLKAMSDWWESERG